MTKGRIFLYFCLSFVGGIFIHSFLGVSSEVLWGVFVLGLILVFSLWKDKNFVVIGACLVLVCLGVFRHEQALDSISEIATYNDRGEVRMVGSVSGEPDVRVKSTQLTIDARELITDGRQQNISGEILVTTSRYQEYKYGDELELIGELKEPTVDLDGFNYKNYLSKDGIYSVMYFPEITYLGTNERGPTSLIYAKILDFKSSLRESIYKNVSPPQSEILGAVLLGDKRKLSDDLKEKLNITGTRHITAISGMHITIVIGILIWLFLWFGFWRTQAFYFSIIVITLFIIMVGAPASAVRAGVMAGALYFTESVGRPKSASRAIMYAALIMLAINPLLLRLDVGFQLSFLAVMGIAFFQDWFSAHLKFLPEILNIRGIAAMTLSAQLTTLPILIYNFGRISFVSVFANILIVPLLPFIMIGGFISGFIGIFIEKIGQILSWPIWLLLTYITSVIDFFAAFPFASTAIENVHWIWVASYYLFLCWFYQKFVKHRVFDK